MITVTVGDMVPGTYYEAMDPGKLRAEWEWPLLKGKRELRSFFAYVHTTRH
jgi:hypothetical protein